MAPSASMLAATAKLDLIAAVKEVGPSFAARAEAHDATDTFVHENYRDLEAQRLFSAGVPLEFGGGGASHSELCAMLRELARYCGSTALALAMHTHLVAAAVWRYRQGHAVQALLKRIAAEQLVLVSTGASDWLDPSGNAEPVDGGYRVSGRKIFGSGSPLGKLLMTSAPCEDASGVMTVLHFPVPMDAPGVSVRDNWRTLGMRATGSNDVVLDNVFVPESAVWLRRPKGEWHPYFNVIAVVAQSIVMSVYVGVAEAARDLALQQVQRKRDDPDTWYLVGEMENALTTGRLAVDGMVALCAEYTFVPDLATGNAALVRKTIAAEALLSVGQKAVEAVGGSAFFRSLGLERLLRDLHGAQFHPLQAKRQHRFTGRVTLGLDPVG